MKIIVFILNAAIQLGVAVVGMLFLILAMNGFHENDATPGLILYIVLAFASAVGLGLASAFTAGRLVEKYSLNNFGAAAAAVIIFAVVGAVILIVAIIAALSLASYMHGSK